MSNPASPVRLAFCITDLDPGGAERALVQIVTRLDRQRWEPAIYCLSAEGRLAADLQAADVPVTCDGARGLRDWGVVRRLARDFKTQRPQLLQTFLFHANLAGRLAGWWARVPHIVSGIRVAEKRANRHLLLDRLTNRLVDVNVCVSRAVADFTVSVGKLRREKVVVIPNGVDYHRFAQAEAVSLEPFGIPPGSRVIVSVGRLDPQKGLVYLLRAMPTIAAAHPNVQLLLVGEGPQRPELESLAAELDITRRVHFAGWQSNVPGILRACDCLALPSLWEGMANVVLEGMAAGIPVVATEVEGVSEQIVSGENGISVASESPSALSAGLMCVLSDSELATRLAQSAQHIVHEKFTWENVAADYEKLYAEILKIEIGAV